MKLLGIDIGSAYMKCLLLERDRDGSSRVLAQDSVEICPDPLRPDQEHKLQTIHAFIRNFLNMHQLKKCQAVVSLSGFLTHTRVLQLPPFDAKKLGGFLEAEAETICPHGGEEMLYNYSIQCEDPSEPKGIICLTRQEDLAADLQELIAVGVEPIKVLLGPLTVAQSDFCTEMEGLHALIDVGAKSTRITVRRDSSLVNIFQVPLGLSEPIRNFSRNYHCTMEEAQAAFHHWLNIELEEELIDKNKTQKKNAEESIINASSAADTSSHAEAKTSNHPELKEQASDQAAESEDEAELLGEDDFILCDDEIDDFFSDVSSDTILQKVNSSATQEESFKNIKETNHEPVSYTLTDREISTDEGETKNRQKVCNSTENALNADEGEILELEPDDYTEAEAPQQPLEPHLNLQLSDTEVGNEDGQPTVESLPQTETVYLRKDILIHAEQYFPESISKLLGNIYRTFFRLRKESGIEPQELDMYFYGYPAGSSMFIRHASACLPKNRVSSCKVPEHVEPQHAVCYALAYAAAHSSSDEPDMLPQQFIRRRLKKSVLHIKAAMILLALLPLPLLLGSIISMNGSAKKKDSINQKIAELKTGMEEEKLLEQQMDQAKSNSYQIRQLHKNREAFFTLIPAFNSIAQNNVWIYSMKIEDTADGAGGQCQLQAWSYSDMDGFMQRLQQSKVVKECSLLKASDGDELQKGELTVGEIEGTKKGTAYVTGDLTYLLDMQEGYQ